MKNKETLFSKNNYDIQLEEVLDKKEFDDEAKSLILGILYRIEESYKDYAKVKLNVKLKNKIIEEIINIIRDKCDKIEILNPENSKNKFQVDRKNKIVKVFPNEVNLLQSLYYINTQNPKKAKSIFNKAIINTINNGEALNNTEIIRDFNGWSWNNVIDTDINKYYNLIYQDLLLLLENETLRSIINSKDIQTNLQKNMNEIYGEKNANNFLELFKKCCILIYVYNNEKRKNEVIQYLDERKNELMQITNKSDFISKITIENNNNMKIVSKIENMLKSEALILKKFNKEKIKEKYKTIENYKQTLNKMKNIKTVEINKNSKLLNPFEYVKRKNTIECEIKSLKYNMKLNYQHYH